MDTTFKMIILLSLFTVIIDNARGDVTVSIQLGSFSNPLNKYYEVPAMITPRTCCCVCTGSGCCTSNIREDYCTQVCPIRFHICAYNGNGPQVCAVSKSGAIASITFPQGRTYSDLVNPVQLTLPGPVVSPITIQINIYASSTDSQSSFYDIGNSTATIPVNQLGASNFSDNITFSNDLYSMSYAYRMRCADNFYGEDCSVNCVPVRNDTGIFVCNSNGNSTRVMCTTSSAYATKGAIFSIIGAVLVTLLMSYVSRD